MKIISLSEFAKNETGRPPPRLAFLRPTHQHEVGFGVEIAIITPNGPVPLIQHVPAACAKFPSKGNIQVLEMQFMIYSSPGGWETTVWDHVHSVAS